MLDVPKIASLANLPLSYEETAKFHDQFTQTLQTISIIEELDTSHIQATSQVTPLQNRWREDVVDLSRMLSPTQALSTAVSTYQGFFKVKAIF